MAVLKNRSLFFTTSPRSPSKMIPEIKLLCEQFSGQKWNKQTQTEFINCLKESDFFEGKGSSDNKDFSARDRINRAPKSLGFVDVSPNIRLTEAGEAFVYGKRPQEVFLRQLLKFQLPSPYHRESSAIENTFCVKPYLEIMRLIRDLEYISFDELKIFALTLTSYTKYDAVKKSILKFREEKKGHKGNYKVFANEHWTMVLEDIYSQNIKTGNIKTRESKKISIKKFIETKKANARDYTDACFRYLRYTGLVSISQKEHSISFFPDKIKDVDYILENVDRKPVFIDDENSYKAYLFDANSPQLYVDDVDNIIDYIMRISKNTRRKLSKLNLDQLKDLRDSIVSQNKDAVITEQVAKIKSYALYSEIIDTYHEILSNGYYDTPLMLEYNTWRAMTMLDGGKIKGNFKFDDVGMPLSTALGNMSDIECYYGDFVLSVEVTMQQGQRQYESEGEPVTRHFGRLKQETGKETYCLFIAPNINDACLAHFYISNKTSVSYYGGKTKIIPLTLGQFMMLVDKSYNYRTVPSPVNIRQFLDEIIRQEDLSRNEKDWNERIQSCVENWLSQD